MVVMVGGAKPVFIKVISLFATIATIIVENISEKILFRVLLKILYQYWA